MSRQCPSCFTIQTDADTFCGRCGAQLGTGGLAAGPPPQVRNIRREKRSMPPPPAQRQTEIRKVTVSPASGAGHGAGSSTMMLPTQAAALPFDAAKLGSAIWLFPIFLMWFGGLIAWSLTRGTQPELARNLLLTGLGVSAFVWLILMVAAWG